MGRQPNAKRSLAATGSTTAKDPAKGNPVTYSDYAHACIIVDRSGSMGEFSDPPRTKAQDATDGVRKFVEEQRAQPGKITFSLTQFNTTRQEVTSFSDGRDLLPSKTEDLEETGWTCHPTGGTALLDAIADVITKTGQRLEKMPEDARPGKVVVMVWTDGVENSSVKYPNTPTGRNQVADMVAHQRDAYQWQFVFMGIGEEAYLRADDYGFQPTESVFVASAATAASYDATNSSVNEWRSGLAAGVSYSPEQRTRLAGGNKTK